MGSVKATQVSMLGAAIQQAREWIDQLNNYFFQASGVPKVLLGDVKGTSEAGVKMSYFAFQQQTTEDQAELIKQIKTQLGLKVTLKKPASLEDNLRRDNVKDGSSLKPSDTTATIGGNK